MGGLNKFRAEDQVQNREGRPGDRGAGQPQNPEAIGVGCGPECRGRWAARLGGAGKGEAPCGGTRPTGDEGAAVPGLRKSFGDLLRA